MAILDALINVGGGLLGRAMSKEDRERAERYAEEAIATYDNLTPPELERIVAERMSTEEYDSIPQDSGNRNARNEAIRRLMEEGVSGGMSPQSQLEYEQSRRNASALEQQGRASVRQEMARRGLGGVGEATLQLQAQQQAADRANMADLQTAADARTRALQSLAQGGGMAAAAEQQDTNKQLAINQSRDRIRQFNAEMAMRASQANNASAQQQWQNQMGLADRRYNARLQGSNVYGGRAADTARMWGGAAQGIAEGVAGAEQALFGMLSPGGMANMGSAGGAMSAGNFAPQTTTPYVSQYAEDPRKKNRGGGASGAPAAPSY